MTDESEDWCVTVVVPTYDRPASLRTAVHSVLEERSIHIEVLVVDDASPAGPPELAEWTDERVRIICREHNGGVAAAQNSGLREAACPYVVFLHSDDEWLPGHLDRQLEVLTQAGPSAGAVESATIESTAEADRVVPPRVAGRSHRALRDREVRGVHISGLLFRREALLSIDGFDEDLRCYEDLDLLIRFTEHHTVAAADGSPVVKIDRRGEDRLGRSPWMSHGRLHLLRKYWAPLDDREDPPAGWRDWATQSAADLVAGGRRTEAGELLRFARRGDLRRAVTTAPLQAAALLPATFGSRIAAWRLQAWGTGAAEH